MSDRIELAVVGAHLSGLQLNGQLIALAAILCRNVPTTRSYRLYALAGEAVSRPGVLRVGEGAGEEIETEVWTLDAASFGRFVTAIPLPLSIGTLLLADRSAPKGFLVEPEGLLHATDITHFGGWRAYLASLRGESA